LFGRGDRVLVALSGGPDSMTLLHALAHLRGRLGHGLVAHGVDHGLRAEAAAELDRAEAFARQLGVPFDRSRLAVPAGGNLQARAREARYVALREAAARAQARVIATAHHREDRAETVLLRLLRGAGPRGLAVLPPRAGDLVRPFIHASRAAIEAHATRHGIPSSIDPSNRDPRFLRARVRHELLPLLRVLSPGIDEHLAALAEQLGGLGLEGDVLPGLPRASRQALAELAKLAKGHSPRARVALPKGHVARWDRASRSIAVEAAPAPPVRGARGKRATMRDKKDGSAGG
jgi:tRNA(Ile)-lysidine synthase